MIINSSIKNNKRYDINKLIEFIVEHYFKHEDIILSISYNDNLCDHFSTDDVKLDAILDKTQMPKHYNLVMREYAPVREVICHEMVHLDQYERGDLSINKFEDKIYFNWKGEDFDPSTPYDKRPWEEEAYKLQSKLWKEFKKWVS